MDSNRKLWNKGQSEFRKVLLGYDQLHEAIQLFMNQHAMLHSAKMVQTEAGHTLAWSYEDETLNDMNDEQVRRIPHNCEHSVVWSIWHIARIEDVTMNMLVAGDPQILHRDNWLEQMKIAARDTGNEMDGEGVAKLSATIEIEALRVYRLAVGRRTREIAAQLQLEQLKQKVEPSRLQQVREEGAVVEAADYIVKYWGRRDIAGLLLMPPTRHSFLHLNEAMRIKHRRQ